MRDVKSMRPLTAMYQPGERFDITADGLNAWQQSAAYQRVFGSYRNYPERSLQSDEARALLHHLIVMRKPERALEIGTYEAGTTEVLARAMWEADRGHLDTIDPFGGERCPPLIAKFPAKLQERITFLAMNSGSYFDRAMARGMLYDFIFIDGNHEFEYALFDLMCAARLIRPGGLVVLDNIEQPGPRLATKMFLESHPQWNDVADVVRKINPAAPFMMPQPSFPDTKFYLLEAPPFYGVGDEPRSFGSSDVDKAEVHGIDLELASPARGKLHIHVFARTFGLSPPEELDCQMVVDLDTSERRVRIPLDRPLRSTHLKDGLPRRVEIILAFPGDQALALTSPPAPYPAQRLAHEGS